MRVLKYDGNQYPILPPTHDIILGGDQHMGNENSYDEGVELMYDYVLQKKNRFIVLMGDRIEAIAVGDKRYDAANKKDVPLQQAKNAIKQDKRIAKRCLGQLMGNHEKKLWYIGNLSRFMCEQNNIPYTTYTSVFDIHGKHGSMYKMFLWHGNGSMYSNAKDYQQRIDNYKNTLKNKLKYKAGDCLLMGMAHTHKLLSVEPIQQLYLTYETGMPKQHYLKHDPTSKGFMHFDTRWYVNTGSFLKLYGNGDEPSYAEEKGYDPIELGFIVVHIVDEKISSVERIIVGFE